MYSILMARSCGARQKLATAVLNMVQDRTRHPAVLDVQRRMDQCVVQRAVLLAAMVQEPDFLQHVLEMPSVCSSTLSEYVVNVLPAIVDDFMCGKTTLPEFVLEASHAYVIL